MIKSRRSSGVTLLEVMLVLAVAAMVIVMSIRYYKNATNSQNSNLMLTQINAIMAGADQVVQGVNGAYNNAAFTDAAVTAIVGANNMLTPFGTAYTVTGASATTYTLAWGTTPPQVCAQVTSAVIANPKVTVTSACSAAGAATLTYTSTN